MKRNSKIYIPIILFVIAIGVPSRIIPQLFPNWYNTYAGDFLWAIVVFLLFANIFRLKTKTAFFASLIFAYTIEVSQLFHPGWLESIRSIKVFALVLGHGFLWSDIIAYTLGISLVAIVDRAITSSTPGN